MIPEASQQPVIGILAIQGDFQAHSLVLGRLGFPTRFVKKAADLEGLAGLILPGGESTTLLKFFEEEALWEPIRGFAETHPVFGTCAGAILMAKQVENPCQRSLGLIHMKVRRNAYGRQIYSFIRHAEAGPELQSGNDAGSSLEAVMIRAPIILETAPEVKVLARLDEMAILVRQDQWLAATFHPELTTDTRVHRYFCQMVCSESATETPAAAGSRTKTGTGRS